MELMVQEVRMDSPNKAIQRTLFAPEWNPGGLSGPLIFMLDIKIMALVVKVNTLHINITPDGFRYYARLYLECAQKYRRNKKFNPVPYYLCCRCIELGFKAILIEKGSKVQKLKNKIKHDLKKALTQLEKHGVTKISPKEKNELLKANKYYKDKNFEYFKPYNTMTGYKELPDLRTLKNICKKLIK